jgi:hypothetical protein
MGVSNQPSFVSTIMFDIKDQVKSDLLVSHWDIDLGAVTFVNEGTYVV